MTEQEIILRLTRAEREVKTLWALLGKKRAGGTGIIDIRFNAATAYIEVLYADDPQTWIPKIEFKKPCPTTPIGQPT